MDGGIDLMEILNGGAMGRQLRSLETRIKNDTFDDDAEKEEVLSKYAAAQAAKGLWLKNISKCPWVELQKNLNCVPGSNDPCIVFPHAGELPVN